jgi:hypothetical protein
MVAELILEFEGVTEEEYKAVNAALGINPSTGEGDWPQGMLTHAAGLSDKGRFVVTEVWESTGHQAAFMEDRLGPALAKGGITGPPAAITWIELIAHHRPVG